MDNNAIAFSKLKPVCVNFMRNCSVENIDKIENVIKELDSDSVGPLLEYIAVPFMLHLQKMPNEKVTIRCIEFLTFIFKKGRVKVWSFFSDIFITMLAKITNFQDMDQVSSASEEIKISVCEILLCLVQCSTEEVLNEMYSLSFRPYLAQAFFVFKILLRDEKSKTLLKAVLRAIGGFVYNGNYVGEKHEKTELMASEILASYLPGLSSALHRIICSDDKQVHSIIIMALDILTDLIVLVVGNKSYERSLTADANSNVHHICHKSDKETPQIPLVIKDEAWFKSVSERLEKLISNINISTHYHWKVRLEFLKCSKLLLFNCSKTLGNCVATLLPSIFALSVDKNEDVSSQSRDILVSLSEELQSVDSSILNSVIEENIENLMAQLIKCQFSENTNKKLSTLRTLLGYIKVSSFYLNKLLFSMTYLERIIMSLVTLLEFDTLDLNLVEEMPVTEIAQVNLMWPKKRFRFFENEEILTTVCEICYCLAGVGKSRFLINYLLDKMSSNNFTLQCIFVIGNIIKGLAKEPEASQKYSNLISDILEVFLSSSLFNIPVSNSVCLQGENEPSVESTCPNILNRNKLQVCLILESIAYCSQSLGIEFRFHLLSVLCRVMEKAGSSNFIISECGRLCLYHIAQSCKYESVCELIKDNANYITNVIMINFHEYLHKPEIAIVLRVAIEQSDAKGLVLFRELIFQILDFVDYNQTKAYPLLNVLFSILVCIRKWFPCKKDDQGESSATLKNTPKSNIKSLIAEYITLKQSADLNSENDTKEDCYRENAVQFEPKNDTEIFDNCITNEDKPDDVPLHVSITCEIFKRCIHLQSSQDRFVRMLTLETTELCILILSDHEKELHPLVHKFWSPFLKRFTEDTVFVPKAFSVLLAIANECRDFIRSRTLKDVIPKLVHFLRKEYSESLQKCHFKQYQWTSDHSLQLLVLSEIGNLCTKLEMDGKDVNAVISACLPYLEEKQPKELQEAAAKSLNALGALDPDSVWFYWNVSFSDVHTLTPPHKDLLPLSFPHSNNSLTSVGFDFLKVV